MQVSDLDFDRPDIEPQILDRIRKIDETMRKAQYGFPCNERTLAETRKRLCDLHYAICGNF